MSSTASAAVASPASSRKRGVLASLGPTMITASVVIGPGTITVSSKLGAGQGYAYLWVIVVAAIFMWLFATMAARVTMVSGESLMTVVARLYGRPLAVVVGVLAFVVTTAFQLGNYLASATALTTLTGVHEGVWVAVVGACGLFFLGVRQLYRLAERVMSVLVFAMVAAFFVNMIAARPDWTGVAAGVVPKAWPGAITGLVLAMTATTFSVIAAYYQGTLARQKGWTADDLVLSRRESAVGIGLLATISCVIMITAGTVLRGQEVDSAAMLAGQFEPVLGPVAVWLFSFGFLAAALSSVVINPMVGGGLLSDGLGLGAGVNEKWPRLLAATGMAAGVGFAYLTLQAESPLEGIVLAQRLTIFAVPLCAVILALLVNDRRAVGGHRNGWFANTVALTAITALVTMSLIQLFR